VRAGVAQEVVETFEDEYAKGRDVDWTWVVHPTRSYPDASIDELLSLATTEFAATDNKYYPYFIVLIDERTAQDGSVLLVQRDPWYPPQWELRITPRSLATFFSVADIGHTTIEGVLINDKPDDDDQWVHDVPFDFSIENAHENSRQAVGFSKLKVGGEETEWFGAVPASVLVLSGEYEGERKRIA